MIPHHVQALTMTAMVADRASSPDLPLMAERMDVSQRDGIRLMEQWLQDRGEEVPDASGATVTATAPRISCLACSPTTS